ncbi:MAG: D-sedoheptulose 7-phosphate isomerase [Ignavibacteria bacterium]|nr:D-sedoheptulose 7-phosphate isomerase [Ignavibacteria bacterium]
MDVQNFYYDVSSRVEKSIATKRKLIETVTDKILETGIIIAKSLEKGNKVLLCGNGGSAADSQHIAAELVIRFRSNVNRKGLPALALTVDPSIMTAGGNDFGFENVFAREVEAYGKAGDILIGISTSGNSPNVIKAVEIANTFGLTTIGLLGGNGGKIAPLCNYSVIVPESETALIQECHIMIGHIWCEIVEEYLFPELFRSRT